MQEKAKGNEENMEKVRAAMEMQKKVSQGGKLTHLESIHYESKEGNLYEGDVLFGKPTAMDLMKIGGLKSEYLRQGGAIDVNLVDRGIKHLAHVMAILTVVLKRRPEWLKDVTLVMEVDVLYHVFDKYDDWESQFRKPIPDLDADDSEASEGEETVDTP